MYSINEFKFVKQNKFPPSSNGLTTNKEMLSIVSNVAARRKAGLGKVAGSAFVIQFFSKLDHTFKDLGKDASKENYISKSEKLEMLL